MNRLKYITILAFLSFSLTACGKVSKEEQELAQFSESISTFTLNIKNANDDLNAIDVTSPEATNDMLLILDQLNEEFSNLAKLEVPEQYDSIESLAEEASQNMNNAVTFFHSAYDTAIFNEQDADIAYQYYCRAMMRIEYIGYILSDNLPENDNVTVYEETNDSKLINKILQRNEDENGSYSYTEAYETEITTQVTNE